MTVKTVEKLYVEDFNSMQDFIHVYDEYTPGGTKNGVVDDMDSATARQDFTMFLFSYKKGEKIPFNDPYYTMLRNNPDAYTTIDSKEEALAVVQQYEFSISEQPKDRLRCGCMQFGLLRGMKHIQDIYGPNVEDHSINLAVLHHQLREVQKRFTFQLVLPNEVLERMKQYGAAYNQQTAILSFKRGGDQTLNDPEHPTKKAIFALAAEENAILITTIDDAGVMVYQINLETGEVKEEAKK